MSSSLFVTFIASLICRSNIFETMWIQIGSLFGFNALVMTLAVEEYEEIVPIMTHFIKGDFVSSEPTQYLLTATSVHTILW